MILIQDMLTSVLQSTNVRALEVSEQGENSNLCCLKLRTSSEITFLIISTGSEWVLEDTIHLKNIHLPRIQVDPHLDLSYLYDSRFLQKKQRLNNILQTLSTEDIRSPLKNGEQNDHHANLHKAAGGMFNIKIFVSFVILFPA